MEHELFPIEDVHMGELNPMIGRRIFNQKMGELKNMRSHLQLAGKQSNRPSRLRSTYRGRERYGLRDHRQSVMTHDGAVLSQSMDF